MVSGKLNNHMWKHETEPLSYTTHTNQVKMVKALNIRPETIKLLEQKLFDGFLHSDFWDLTPKVKSTKAKINK